MSLVKNIKKKTKYSKDYIIKEMSIKGTKVVLFFNEVLTDSFYIDEFILKQLILLDKKSLNKLENALPVSNIIKIKSKVTKIVLNIIKYQNYIKTY